MSPTHPLRAFRYRDFRLLWTGSLFSFMGSWVQNVAQGWLVDDMTRDPQKVAMVFFCGMLPVAVFGPFAGVLADRLDRRLVLVATQLAFASGALFLGVATSLDFVQYWHILAVAFLTGAVSAIEMPTRQSLIATVVPAHDVAAAIPAQAMTFNLARVAGPVAGGMLLARYGPSACYFANGFSYAALILAVLAIRADLRAPSRRPEPMVNLLLDGMLHTWRDMRLRTLFLMEVLVSMCGLFYLALMPTIAREQFRASKVELGFMMGAIGVGAVLGLTTLLLLSHLPVKALVVRSAMTALAMALFALSWMNDPTLAYPLLAVAGAAGVMQFNTTNTLFQLLAPEKLRGRVISMHVWALAGAGPIAMPLFGWIASTWSTQTALLTGSLAVACGAAWGWMVRDRLAGIG
jgi:MFS family permease